MSQYSESFYHLYHGTDAESAEKICNDGFIPSKAKGNWCGSGVYFYNIRSKAYWSAVRTCETIKKRTGKKVSPTIVHADIIDLPRNRILDLRTPDALRALEDLSRHLTDELDYEIDGVDNEFERKSLLRAFLIEYCTRKMDKLLVIGLFRQRERAEYSPIQEIAESLDLVFGTETIYCAKDTSIISNISQGG